MIVEYNKGLKSQKFYEKGKLLSDELSPENFYFLGEIDNPVLAFDRNKISNLEGGVFSIIRNGFGESLEPIFSKYESTVNGWYKLPGTWPATIDTVVFLDSINSNKKISESENILDLGCGTGMVGQYAVNSNKNIKNIDFSDINSRAVKTSKMNMNNFKKRNIVANYNVGDAFQGINEKYDVILASALPSTPPYPGLKRELNPLFEGTSFLEKILREAPNHLNEDGKLIMSSFSVGDHVVDDLMKKYGANITADLGQKNVPFRVEFLNDEKWVDYLVEKGGMKIKDMEGHKYWHICRVREISFE